MTDGLRNNKVENNRIGLLTFHDTTNFGAVLQATALYKTISEIGLPIEIINYHCTEIDRRELPKYQFIASPDKMMWIVKFILRDHKNVKKHNKLWQFIQGETKISREYYNKKNIKLSNQRYDCFIIGSDMLWSTDFTLSDYTYMLDFVDEDKKKYAFATSGVLTFPKEDALSYLNSFSEIAVREEILASEISILVKRNVYLVCDPTMLVRPEVWREYLTNRFENDNYCLMYFDDNEGNVCRAIANYSERKKIQARNIGFNICGMNRKKIKTLEIYTIGDFLASIANTKMLFTASYHGMLFAIYFHVPFVYFNKDSSRLENVAKKLGLEGRNGNRYEESEMGYINWKDVDEKREKFRQYSMDILISMLHGLH